MCGILAVFCSSTPKQIKQILEGGKYLGTRGPDFCNSIVKKDGVYIFHRLAINDTSGHGNQPMISKSADRKIVMMCNGEIYNHKDLRERFKLKCRSKSDCEVILKLYQKIGFVETVKQLDGVFAIILVDGDTVYMARDRIGVRPLFFGITVDNYLATSSVPNALHGWCKNISHFPPGSCAIHKKGGKDMLSYIHKDEIQLPIERSYTPGKLFSMLSNAVEKRLMSDRPIGCLLSGGLDSSIVACILVKLLGAEKVRTYSVGMKGSTDLYYAKEMADFLGNEHHEVIFTPEEGFDAIPEVIKAIGSYDITTVRASIGMYLVSKYISEKTKDRVIFSGEGSDEILCGYLYFHNSPTHEDADNESLRLINQLHLYDVLRADRTVSHHGLELRVPFLDRQVVDTALAIPANAKVPVNHYEKHILRNDFIGYLPDKILWRRKEGFSDGVSSVKESWFSYVQKRVDSIIPDIIYSKTLFPSKEAMYYRLVFNKAFPYYELSLPYWMPKWSDTDDPSGRLISAYDGNRTGIDLDPVSGSEDEVSLADSCEELGVIEEEEQEEQEEQGKVTTELPFIMKKPIVIEPKAEEEPEEEEQEEEQEEDEEPEEEEQEEEPEEEPEEPEEEQEEEQEPEEPEEEEKPKEETKKKQHKKRRRKKLRFR